ncbi:hypothetical protein N9Y42_05805 [Mariniblastus sp.]|nr:hypothetical protein [Mariniblastus sp.]
MTKPSPVAVGRRHQQQLESLVPAAWQNELLCDVAVFDDQVLQQLSSEEQQRVVAVKKGLDLITSGRLDEAENSVAEIPRKDPLSQWRLLIRGLKHWFSNDLNAAKESWNRLDANRRPARIACALTLAHRDDLADVSVKTEVPIDIVSNPAPLVPIDNSLLLGAKVVRRMRIDRPAIKKAAAEFGRKDALENDVEQMTLSPVKLKRIIEFAETYRSIEPELVEALEITALQRAACQPFANIFAEASKQLRGPSHDRENYLRSSLYYMQFEDSEDEDPDAYLESYLTSYLPSNEEISPTLRSAILSVAWMQEAMLEISLLPDLSHRFRFFENNESEIRDCKKAVRKNFAESIKAYPANRNAHKFFTEWLKSELDDDDVTTAAKKSIDKEIVKAMEKWAKAEPNYIEPRQFLAENLLEQEQLEAAAPHVQWLMSTRPESPLLRALPWKLKLLEAIQFSRRKTTLSKVAATLDELETLWPEWLSKQWLPYFRAASALRQGNESEYQSLRDSICQTSGITRDSVADACMMLGAAQKMKVPSADLKPLRVPVDAAVKNKKSLAFEDLAAAGSFFWDILKTNIAYPALRMHGGKFGKELLERVKKQEALVENNLQNPQFRDCLFWFSDNSFWGGSYQSYTPAPILELKLSNPNLAAVHLNATIKKRWIGRDAALVETANYLKQAAGSEPNTFNRFWFAEIAEKAIERDRELNKGSEFSNMFANMFGGFEEDDEIDTDDGGWPF